MSRFLEGGLTCLRRLATTLAGMRRVGRSAGSGPTAVALLSRGPRPAPGVGPARLQVPDLEPEVWSRRSDSNGRPAHYEPLAAFFHHGPPASRKVCGAGGCGPAGFRGYPPPAARISPRCYTVVVKSRSVSVPPERPRGIKGSRTRRSARGSGLSLMGARPRLKRGRNAPGQTSVMIAQTVASGVVDVDRIDVEVLCA